MNIGIISGSDPVPGITNTAKLKSTSNEHKQMSTTPVKPQVITSDLQDTKRILDEYIDTNRFSYSINEKLDQFIVKIIDKDTDKVIREIPSKEMQSIHENLKDAIGMFIDRMV